ncbi:hypothetical protein [Micromonospora sp. NPDC004704]
MSADPGSPRGPHCQIRDEATGLTCGWHATARIAFAGWTGYACKGHAEAVGERGWLVTPITPVAEVSTGEPA